ncbi:MAG: transglutaminase domain-containing protein [Cyanobacteria bacterium J06638_22]
MLLEPASSASPDDLAPSVLPALSRKHRIVRPIIAKALHGICFWENLVLAADPIQGYLFKIDPETDSVTILNAHQGDRFLNVTGLAIAGDTLWLTRDHEIYCCPIHDLNDLQLFATLPYPAEGIAVWQSTVYVTCQRSGYILIFDAATRREITRFSAPGVGAESLTVQGEELWVCDRLEQTVYCIDRATGELQFSILTPFKEPTGLAFHPVHGTLYVAYSNEEPYIRDNPNNLDSPYELTLRDRTFLHPLHFRYDPERKLTLSNGFLLEMTYVEEIAPLEDVDLQNLEWRIALPAETDRQTLRAVEPVGMPFTEEVHDGQRVAVFRFDHLKTGDRYLFGWNALLEVRGIKYQYTYDDVYRVPALPLDYQSCYLVDDDDLAMDTPLIQQVAREAIGTETNLLRKLLKIRNTVYDRLSYGLTTAIDAPDVVWERGVGSCGEYVGVLLALARLNGIACRTVGRYKCPPFADRRYVPLEPDYNHVWIEFYIPGVGWLPMESNVDDVTEGGPYPTRFFMGLPWWHAEMAKDISFETLSTPNADLEVSIGDLAINHIRFTILGELPPP